MNLLEVTFKRLKKHFYEDDCAFISACRTENTPEENNKATLKLADDLKNMGYGYIKINGAYVETLKDGTKVPTKEKSFAVFNQNDKSFPNWKGGYETDFKRDMIVLCRKYNQNVVLIKLKNQPGHYCDQNGNEEGNFNEISQENIQDYYSRLRNNTFVFTEMDESDKKEDYSRYNQTYGTRVLRFLLYSDLKKQYPDLFEKDGK